MIKQEKAQAWGIDLMIAVVIFSVGISVFYIYSLNSENQENIAKKLNYDGEMIIESLFSSGFPQNWNSGNVVKIGIVDNGKINQTKLELFYLLAKENYPRTKILFNTKYDYLFFLSANLTISGQEVEAIGKPGADKDNVQSENLIKITRFTINENKPVTAYLYVWE